MKKTEGSMNTIGINHNLDRGNDRTHWFLRESTIATGGEVCDCHYVSKKAATPEEIRRSKENKRAEAIRGGRKEF